MKAPVDSGGSLDALVAGKRRVPRVEVSLPIRVKGVHGEFEGMVHDLSMDGALVCVPIAQLEGEAPGPLGPAEQFGLLERHFRDSFDLVFEGKDVVVEAQVVRLLVSSDDEEATEPELALGCRFVSPLTKLQQAGLGLLGDGPDLEVWGEATARHDPRWRADPARPVNAFLFDGREGVAGPPCIGLVRALGRSALVVRLTGATREEVRAHMTRGDVHARILHGPRELVAMDTEFVTARYCDRPSPGVEVLLATKTPLPRAVRKHFVRG